MCLGDAFSVAFILSWYTQDKVLQWRYLCCVWWAHCRLKEPKRPCWTCEAISHKYDLQKKMMERKDRVVWGRRYIYHGSTHDYVNLVRSKGVDIWQTITGLCTDVASQGIFRIAAWLFAIGWQVKSFKPESKADFFFGWKCYCISLFCYFFFLFLLSAWSLPKQVSCSLRGYTSLLGNGFVHWCKWRTSCQSICPSQFHQLGSLHQEFQEALQNK